MMKWTGQLVVDGEEVVWWGVGGRAHKVTGNTLHPSRQPYLALSGIPGSPDVP